MTDAWGYVRLSQDGSLDEQKEAIRKYCRNNGLNLQTTRNEGKETSGFNSNRKEYQLLLEKIENEAIDAVVVRDRARLSRDFDDRLSLLQLFRATDVEWHVTESGGKINVNDEQMAAMECIHAAMDHVKKMAEIERSREAVQQIKNDESRDLGRPKFGMTYENGRQVPDDNFHIVETVIEELQAGRSKSAVADNLPISRKTVQRIWNRREWYANRTDLTLTTQQ